MECIELKICMSDKHHRYYEHTKFRQNPRGDPKFLVDLTWNDPNVKFPVSYFLRIMQYIPISNEYTDKAFLCTFQLRYKIIVMHLLPYLVVQLHIAVCDHVMV